MTLADRLAELSPKPPRVLTLDLESSPATAYIWRLRTEYVSPTQIIEPSRVLCWAGKWLDSPKTMFYSEFHHGREAMIEAAWQALDEADVLVTYNGVRFDVPHLQREFVEAGYAPPSPWIDVDLLKVVRSRFAFMSNKLGYVTSQLGLDSKLDAGGLETWKAVLAGNRAAWETFRAYNKVDVEVTESLLVYLRKWVKGLPHAGLFTGDLSACHDCGSTNLVADGIARTKTRAYLRLRCECGALNRQLTNGETRPA